MITETTGEMAMVEGNVETLEGIPGDRAEDPTKARAEGGTTIEIEALEIKIGMMRIPRRDRRSYRGRGRGCGSGRDNWSEPPPYQLSYAPPWGFPYMPYPGFAPPPGEGGSHENNSNKKGQNSKNE